MKGAIGIPATLFVQTIINGVIYAAIAWLIFSLAIKYKRKA